MNIAQPVNSKISGVSFTFYEPSEVRKMSVKQVVNPVLLDALGNPTKGGLYDPAMGPFTKHHLCGTCSLSYFNCPGHFGHIELPTPVVNPMMFDTLYRFLQGCCPYCHKFSFNRVTATRFAAKLRLLEYGLIQEANDLDDLLPRTGKSAFDDEDGEGMDIDESDSETTSKSKKNDEPPEQYIERIKEYVDDKLKNCEKATYKVTMVNNVRRALIKELISRSRNQTCQNCRGPQPKLRRDGYLKLFREPLTRKQQASKQSKGMEYRDVLHLDIAAIEKEIKNGQKAQSKKAAASANGSKKPSEDDMDVDSESDSESVVSEETDVEDAYDSIDAYPKKDGAAAPQKTSVFLTPIHLRNHLRLLFSNEPELIQLLFQQRDPRVANALDVTADVRSKITLTLPGEVRSPTQLADMFFIEALPVPPTKFRPASVMNDEVMENPQNVYLGAVLKSCVYLRSLVSPDEDDTDKIKEISEEGINFERIINSW
ncbi:hypothetical protein GGI12_004229, partial [Dipsacomyces acuminosporus]